MRAAWCGSLVTHLRCCSRTLHKIALCTWLCNLFFLAVSDLYKVCCAVVWVKDSRSTRLHLASLVVHHCTHSHPSSLLLPIHKEKLRATSSSNLAIAPLVKQNGPPNAGRCSQPLLRSLLISSTSGIARQSGQTQEICLDTLHQQPA
jgi:hypothetical protein